MGPTSRMSSDFCQQPKTKSTNKILCFEQSPPSTLSLRPLQQFPPHPGDFDPKFPSALLDIEQHQTGGILVGSTGEYWRAAPARYWPDTRQDPPARDTQRDTRRDPLASRSGGILGRIHWRAALAGYSAGSTGVQLWRDTRRDPLVSSSGGILGRIHWRAGDHWRAALAGFWVGAWCRSIANADSNIKSNNPFLLGGEETTMPVCMMSGAVSQRVWSLKFTFPFSNGQRC